MHAHNHQLPKGRSLNNRIPVALWQMLGLLQVPNDCHRASGEAMGQVPHSNGRCIYCFSPAKFRCLGDASVNGEWLSIAEYL